MVEVQILILAWLCDSVPMARLGRSCCLPQWLSPSLLMEVLPGGDPGPKERGLFPTAVP